jgi:hypothetical protein
MNEWILFTIGIFIGSLGGIMTMAILQSSKMSDMFQEITELRTQRVLLKEELLKRTSRKPTPRKHRRKVSKRKHNV